MIEDLKNQAAGAVDANEGELPDSVPVNSFESQNHIKRHPEGYAKLKIVKTKKGEQLPVWDLISDFHINPVRVERHVDEEEKTVQRIVELVNPQTKYRREVLVQPSELVGKYNFSSWLLSQGNFHFWGTAADIERLLAMTFQGDGNEVLLKNICGYEKDTGNWIFLNGAVSKEGKVSLYDEKEGCILIEGKKYKMAMNERDTNIKRAPVIDFGVDPDKATALLKRVIANTTTLWGPGAETAWAWALSSLWRTKWLAETSQFPILFLIGTPSLGKTQFIQHMVLKLYGLMYEPLSMRQATEVGMYNLINQACNVPVFFDEFKGEMVNNPQTYELLKGNADGAAKIVGSLSQYKTKSRPHRTGLIICGETRAPNEALDSRSINCDLVKNENVALYEETVQLCRGLSCALVRLVRQWEDLWPLIWDRKEVLIKQWRIQSPKTDSRIVLNYARVCSAMDVILPDETRSKRFFEFMQSKGEETQEKNELAKMIQLLPYLIENEKAFIPCRYSAKKHRFAVNAAYLIEKYAVHTRTTAQSSRELIRYGKQAGLLIPMHRPETQGVEIEQLSKEGKIVKVLSKCFLFDTTNPIVKDTVDKLAVMDKSDRAYDGVQPDPNNPDDPFMAK